MASHEVTKLANSRPRFTSNSRVAEAATRAGPSGQGSGTGSDAGADDVFEGACAAAVVADDVVVLDGPGYT
ncbi:uncharacterized protein PG998_013249 [Apiospora kogelbergensis]|uniref:uncharacterized protein n=1 Tax=Apiospora kogelbergensis TaxID=1337665 RepID=UPI00312D2644